MKITRTDTETLELEKIEDFSSLEEVSSQVLMVGLLHSIRWLKTPRPLLRHIIGGCL